MAQHTVTAALVLQVAQADLTSV
jgi:hypothetical protein